MEQDKKVIIQLTTQDANHVLSLVQEAANEAAIGLMWDDCWEDIADQIRECLMAQKDGKFFQCLACHDL